MTERRRFESYSIGAAERPREMFVYYVTGNGLFPFDMLRYDCCWPGDSESAALMAFSLGDIVGSRQRGVRSIKMHSFREPTIARWQSFVWSVGLEKL